MAVFDTFNFYLDLDKSQLKTKILQKNDFADNIKLRLNLM